MAFDLASLGPVVGGVVVIDVTEEQAVVGLVDDDADVARDADGPEVPVARALEPVELHARTGRIQLQVEGRRLHGLLLVTGQTSEAGGEGVGEEEGHRL